VKSTSHKPGSPLKSLPTTSNAIVVRYLVIYQTTSDVVLGFIWWTIGHPPKDDPDPIAGVTGWAFSLHKIKLLRLTDKFLLYPITPVIGGQIRHSSSETEEKEDSIGDL
jgi:hypothetical protein